MSIRKRQLFQPWLAACLFGLLSAAPALAQPLLVQQPVSQPAVNRAEAVTKPTWVGIMGQIVRPGVYEFSVRYPGLDDLVLRAGGLTTAATSNIRIVRNGVAGQMIFFQPGKNFPLADGDLLIVDGQRHAGNRHNPRIVSAGAPAPNTGLAVPAPAEEATLQVGLVNLIHRPVIVKLPRQQANVPAIVALLGQRPELQNSVRVIPGNPHEARQRQTIELTDASVIAFQPAMIRQQDLPAFPPVFTQEQPQPVVPERPAPVITPDPVTNFPPIYPVSPPEPLAPGINLQASLAGNFSPLIVPLQPTIEQASSLNPNPPLVTPLPVQAETAPAPRRITPVAMTGTVKLPEPDEVLPTANPADARQEEQGSGWFGWALSTLILLVSGTAGGGAYWYLKHHRPRRIAPGAEPTAVAEPAASASTESELLTALLKKRLPVTNESVSIGEQIRISRLAEQVFRRDAAELRRPPHFPVAGHTVIPVAEPVVEAAAAETTDDSVIAGEQFGLLDRILSRLEGEQTS